MIQGFLLMLWMDGNASQQSNEKLLMKETYNCLVKQQPNWLELLQMGNRNRCTQQVKYVGNTYVFCFGSNFMSPKWTRTKLVIVISLSPQAY